MKIEIEIALDVREVVPALSKISRMWMPRFAFCQDLPALT